MLPGRFKRCFNVIENSAWMEKYRWIENADFKKCQGTSCHCPQGKPTERVRLWRSVPPPHYCLKGQGADFSYCLGQVPRYSQISIIWYYVSEMTAYSLCITLEGRDAPAALQLYHSTTPRTYPHGFSSGGHSQRNYTAVSTQSPVNPRHMKDNPQKSYIFSLINSSSRHRGHSLPLLCSTLG